MTTAFTGKCNKCGHADNVHRGFKDSYGVQKWRCVHWYKCRCDDLVPQVDIEAHNTIDGKEPIELYEFQKKYLTGLPAKFIFAADTGTGKTYMSLAHYDKHAYLKPLLIIAPAAKANTGDWERELKEYFAGRIMPEYEIYSYEKFSRVPTVAQYKKTGDRGVWRDWLARHPYGFAVIADEVHKAKNPQSGVGKRVFEVASASDFFVGLSATPVRNGYIDMANYFKIFGFSKNITEFKKRYCNISTFRGFPVIDSYYHESELKRLWNGISKPLPKEAALDLPPIVSIPVALKADGEYVKIQKDRMFNDKFLDNPSALLHALRQSTVKAKLPWLDEFIEGASGNIVIFYNYVSELEAIMSLLKRKHKGRKVYQQNGQVQDTPQKGNWGDVKDSITLAQYQSGSTGIELTYANTVVYYSPTYSSIDFEQSIGRVYRNGQNQKCTLYLLCCPSTIEKDIWGCLREKKDFSANVWYANNMESLKSHEK